MDISRSCSAPPGRILNGGLPLHGAIFGRRLRSHQECLDRVIPTAIDNGPTPSCESGNCKRHLFCGPPSICRVEIAVEKEHAECVCVYEKAAPGVLLLLGQLHSMQSEVDPAPQPSRLVELCWLWRSFLRTGMGVWVGCVGFDTTRRGLAGVLSALHARSRLNVSSVASPTWVPQTLGSILEGTGVATQRIIDLARAPFKSCQTCH